MTTNLTSPTHQPLSPTTLQPATRQPNPSTRPTPPPPTPQHHDLGAPSPATFPTLDALTAHLQSFATRSGFVLVRSSLRRRPADNKPQRCILLCDRHGTPRNHRRLTEATRVRKGRASRKQGCAYRINAVLGRGDDNDEERWGFRMPMPWHSHGPVDVGAHPVSRQVSAEQMRWVRRGVVAGEKAVETLEALRGEDPECRLQVRDVHNARARARVEYRDFLDGKHSAAAKR